MRLERRRYVVSPAVKGRQIEIGNGSTVFEERSEIGTGRQLRPLVPSNELDMFQLGPLRGQEEESGGGARVESEGGDGGEGVAEELGEERGVGGGGEERVAPGREEREVEVGDGSETGGEDEEVADVAAEGEVGAGGAFQEEPFPADEGGGVAAACVGNGRDYV